jgi:hypothetical protein
MESYSTSVGGLLLKVRTVDGKGWEVSIIGTAHALDEKTAKDLAESVAQKISNSNTKVVWGKS